VASFIASRGLGVVAFSTRKLENFLVHGLTRQSGVPLDFQPATVARRSDWSVSFSGMTSYSSVRHEQRPRQQAVGG
jgi:hypothetical protein